MEQYRVWNAARTNLFLFLDYPARISHERGVPPEREREEATMNSSSRTRQLWSEESWKESWIVTRDK